MVQLTRLDDHLSGRRAIIEVATGTTVAACAGQAFPALDAEDLVAILNGEILSPECWNEAAVGDSDILVICPRACGPAVAVLAATAVSSFAASAISSAIVTQLALTGMAATFVTAAVTSAVTALGMLVVRSLVPPPSFEMRDYRGSRYWAIEGTHNRRRPYGPVPLLLGRMRIWPDLAAVPLSRPQQNRQDLTTILCWGEGPLELDEASLRTGDTPLSDVGEVQHEYAQGWPGEPPPAFRLYGSDVDVQQVGAQLSESGAPTDWVTRTSGADAETIELVFHFPQGLQSIGRKTGDIFGRTATFEIAHRPVGATGWVTHQIAWSANTTSPISRTWRRQVTGQSEVRVRRLPFTGQSLPRGELAVWAELRTIRGSLPIGRGGLALSALHIEASQRASGSLDAINGVVTSIVPDWSGGAWNMRPSRNPASLCRWLLTGPHNREPVDPSELDDQAWIDWWAECDSRGWTCDLVVDWDASLVEVLRLVAACGHAQVTFSGGLWTPVVDLPRTAVSMFTPRNARISFERDLTERPHGLRVRFVDAAQDWRPSEVTVYADGYDANTAERFEELELPGVTDALQAFRQARKRLAEMEVRRDGYIVRTGIEHLICRVGDRVEIAHDVREATAGYGRVRSVTSDGNGDVTAIEIDTPVPRDPAQSYDVTIRRPGGIDTWMLASGGSDTTLVPTSPIPSAQAPAAGDLVTVGLRQQVTESALVLRVTPDGDGAATLECVRYDESIYAAYGETGGGSTAPVAPTTVPPTVISAHVLEEGGSLVARISLLHAAAPKDATGVVIAWKRTAEEAWQAQLLPRESEQATVGPLVAGDTYEVRARYESRTDDRWGGVLVFTTASPTTEEPAPEVFDLQDWIQSRIDRGESRIELVTPPGTRLSVDGLVAVRQYDPYRHVTVDLSRAAIDAGRDFRLSARGKPLELPRENQFLLEQDALAGATTVRIRTSPQNGDHSLIQIGRRLIIRGQNDARGNTLEDQRHICRITSKTVISTYVVEVGIDPGLPADFLTEYPNSEWVEDSGGPDRTHIAVLSEIMLAQDAAEGDIIVRTNADPATLGFRAGEIVMVEDDRLVKDIAGGSSTNPVRRELNRVVALGADSLRLAFPLARDFLAGWNARVTRLVPSWNLNVICPHDLRITEAQPPKPYQRQPTFELRFAVGCRLVEPRQDDEANGVGRRGQLVRAEAAFACEIVRPWRRGLATDFSDAAGGDRYGIYGVACRFVRVVDGYFERCRHGVVWSVSTDCSSQGSRYVDCLINGWDTHGADSVRCFSVGEEFHAGPSRAPGSTKQSAVTFGNTYHLAGDRDCGVVNGTFIGFTDDDGAVEARTPCSGIVVSGISYGCRYALALRQAGSQDGGSVLVPSFQQLQTPAGGALINDLSGSPKFAPVVLGEVWSDAGEDRYWPSGSSNFAPAARQNFALHRQFITHTDPAAELKIPYSRGQFVEVHLEADVPSVTITSENRARDGDLLFLQVLVRQDGTGGRAWPHPANVTWPGGSPPAATATANRATLFQYMSWDKGASWLGVLVADDLP